MRIQVKGRNDATVEAELQGSRREEAREGGQAGVSAGRPRGRAARGEQPLDQDSQIAEATLHLKGVTLRAHRALAPT